MRPTLSRVVFGFILARIAAAAESYNLLDPHNIDLLDAVRSHLQVIGQKSASVTFVTFEAARGQSTILDRRSDLGGNWTFGPETRRIVRIEL